MSTAARKHRSPHSTQRLGRLLVLVLLLIASAPSLAKDRDEIDYLGLAALMIKDGDYIRAGEALDQVDENNDKLDKIRFYTLRGLVELKTQAYEQAHDDFEAAIAAGQAEAIIHVYLAQAQFGLQDYAKALDEIELAGDEGRANPGVWVLKSQSYWELGDETAAWDTLVAAEGQFPEDTRFTRRRVFLLIQLGLYQEAADLGLKYLDEAYAELPDYIAIGNALRQSRQPRVALRILEVARVRFPGDERAKAALAQVYLGLERYAAAAALLEEAARIDTDYLSDAAELWRRSGEDFRALYLNAQVNDQQKKLRQRLALLLESEQFEEGALMESALYRVGLLDEQDIRYALAYAYYKIGKFDKANEHLEALTKADLFRKGTELRKVMEGCQRERWKCL